MKTRYRNIIEHPNTTVLSINLKNKKDRDAIRSDNKSRAKNIGNRMNAHMGKERPLEQQIT